MLTIFGEKSAGRTAFSRAYHFIFKLIAWLLRHFSDKDLIAGNTILWTGTLKHQPLAVITPVCFRIITTEGELLDIFKMCFIRVMQRIRYFSRGLSL